MGISIGDVVAGVSVLVNELTTKPKTKLQFDEPSGALVDIELSGVISRSVDYANSITDNNVESGVVISDHINSQPVTITISGIVSNSSVELLGGAISGLQSIISGGNPFSSESPTKKAFGLLERVMSEHLECTIVFPDLRLFDGLYMTALSFPRDSATGDAIRFSATFREVRFVETASVLLPKLSKLKDDFKQYGAGKVNVGKKTAKPVTQTNEPGIVDKLSSTLGGLF